MMNQRMSSPPATAAINTNPYPSGCIPAPGAAGKMPGYSCVHALLVADDAGPQIFWGALASFTW